MAQVINTNVNHKSKIIEWTQRQNKSVKFEMVETRKSKNQKEFSIQVVIDDKPYGTGYGFTKKKAEQEADDRRQDNEDERFCPARWNDRDEAGFRVGASSLSKKDASIALSFPQNRTACRIG